MPYRSVVFTGGTPGATILGPDFATYADNPGGFLNWVYAAGGTAIEPDTDGAQFGAKWVRSGDTFAADQSSKLTLDRASPDAGSILYPTVAVRITGAATTRSYFFAGWYTNFWEIGYILNGGSSVVLGGAIAGPAGLAAGDSFELAVTQTGATSVLLELFYNDVLVTTRTHDYGVNTVLAGGTVGFSGFNSGPQYGRVREWEGGDDVGAAAPTITAQPTAQTATAPAAATFTASVSGTYTGLRWQRQAAGAGAWADVVGGTGGTTTSYTTGATSVTGGSFNNTDRFRLAVDWSGGTVFSTDVALTVSAAGAAPAITVQPANQSVTIPSAATFSVTATGSGSLSYQWERQPAAGGGYAPISGANSPSYTTGATALSGGSHNNGDTYRCVVTGDTSPPATSNPATLTVLPPVATTVSLLITTDGTTPAASLTGLKWAFYDQATPDLFTTAPVARGSTGTTNGAGVFVASITGTVLRQGQIGYLIVTNSDGTVTQGAALKGFAGPVVVS
jgi:hypothetical protein